ncbi:MAG: substrate-binding and VWA domain-containing protein [Frankia sp.]
MAARHRSARSSRVSVGAVTAMALLGGAIVFGSVLALRENRTEAASSCSNPLTLTVATTASLTPPLQKEAIAFNDTRHAVPGQCVRVSVKTQSSGAVVAALSASNRSAVDGATPDVWVPDSSDWLAIARNASSDATALVPATGATIASSPVVIASPRPMAEALDWPDKQLTWAELAHNENSPSFWSSVGQGSWGTFKVGYPDPKSSMAGLAAVLGVSAAGLKQPVGQLSTASFLQDRTTQLDILNFERGAAFVPKTDDEALSALRKAATTDKTISYLSAFPISEADLVAFNNGVGSSTGQPPAVQLDANYPSDGLFNQTVPYAVLTAPGAAAKAPAAQAFLAAIRNPAGQAALANAGFRSPNGVNKTFKINQGTETTLPKTTPANLSGATLQAAQSVFTSVHQRGSTLALLDGSGSMTEIVPGNPPQTKIAIALKASVQGDQLFAPNDKVGLGVFSSNVPGGVLQILSPVVPMDVKGQYGTHKDDLMQLVNMPVPGGDTPLYKAALAGFESQSSNYTPGRLNEVVLLTDGKNDDPEDPHDLTLPDLLKTLKQQYNPARPVHIITIAYGADADPSALKQISDATGARSYRSVDPHDVFNVFINAVLQASE